MSQSIKIMPLTDEGFTKNTQFQVYTDRQFDKIEPLQKLSAEQRFEMRVVASVLPFRVNQYVIDELIDWDNVPNDPIFQLTFPQRGMLDPADYDLMAQALRDELPRAEITLLARQIQARLNPHPAGQQRGIQQAGVVEPVLHADVAVFQQQGLLHRQVGQIAAAEQQPT